MTTGMVFVASFAASAGSVGCHNNVYLKANQLVCEHE
jgi:hypothetical protein